MRKYAVLSSALLAVAACQDSTSPTTIATTPSRISAAQNAAANDYIVMFRDDESDPAGQANALVKAHGGSLTYVYRYAVKGFAVANLPAPAVEALRRNPRVALVEPDGIMSADGSGTQTSATWGIDRIDQRTLPLNSTYNYEGDGTGVVAYIIDTGIRTTHTEFGGRASGGYTAISDGNGTNDCNGHGTHVAGTVGGSTYGVAQNVSLVAVRVLGCSGSGSTSGVIAGIDWVRQNHAPRSVANMSLGGGFSSTLNSAVTNAVNAGVTFAVAAGNSNADACNSSPSSAAAAITVGATTSTDAKASFSNYGTCVDINAPGVSITSSWNTSDGATNTISGTSMASPHVAGAAAAYLSLNTGATPAQIAAALTNVASTGHLTGLSNGTPNLLLYVGFSGGAESGGGGGGTEPPPPSLQASFSKTCSGYSCTFTSTSTGPIASTAWTFGDGGMGSGTSVTHTYGSRGNYTVTLTVTDASNATATATGSVNCNPKKCQ